ncbi:hypothetical protein MASR1M107_14760 [Ignavibacteriales bacterium]
MIVYVYVIAATIGILTIGFSIISAIMLSRKTVVQIDPVNSATLLKYSVFDNHRDVPYSNTEIKTEFEDEVADQYEEMYNYKRSGFAEEVNYYPHALRDFRTAGSRIMRPATNNLRVYNSSRPAPMQFR